MKSLEEILHLAEKKGKMAEYGRCLVWTISGGYYESQTHDMVKLAPHSFGPGKNQHQMI